LKEQILYLESHDDYHSMRDKIGWVQTDRVLLVVPKRRSLRRIFSRLLDLQLVQRHAAHLGAKLALVTDDPIICDLADQLGIQIFDRVDDSHLLVWRSRRPLAPSRQHRPGRDLAADGPIFTWPRLTFLESRRLRLASAAFVFFNVIALLTVLLALTMPGAQISLVSRTQVLTNTVLVTADPVQIQIDSAGIIPARLAAATVAGSIEVTTTGSVDQATQKAGGYVTFTNLTSLAVKIPAGAAVRTTGGAPIRFVTQQDVSLDAHKGAAGRAFIVASESGPRGNVAAGLINTIEGPLSVQVATTNEAPITGGEVHQVAAVTDADRQRARDQLLAQLRQAGYAQLTARLNPVEFAPLESLRVADVLEESYDRFSGEEAERLKLNMRIKVNATVVDEQSAFQVGQAALNSQLGSNLRLIPGSVTFTRHPAVTVDSHGRVSFSITALAKASAIIEPDQVRSIAAWTLAEQSAGLLARQFPVTTQPQVKVWPAWFPRLPWLPWRIDVTVQPDGAG
jgi:hypothetical protein